MDSDTCFVIMPFGEKTDLQGRTVRFDDIYTYLISEAVAETGLIPVRSDKVDESGFIHRRMLEYIRDARVAVVDISLLNANVFYELGIRHTLRRSLTVLVRRRGTRVPFNIANLNVIEYDETDLASVAVAKRRLVSFIVNGLRSVTNDSLVHEVLDVPLRPIVRRFSRQRVYEYRFRSHPRSLCLITGGIENVRGVDVWVNSENTNMQMARFYESSVSSIIRYLGARRGVTGHVETADDLIANELTALMGQQLSVPAGTVVPTGSGALEDTHGVKAIFHAAAVQGEVGRGYRPIENPATCVTNALRLFDSQHFRDRRLTTILFPLLGTGVRPHNLDAIVHSLLEAATLYVESVLSSSLERIYFLNWTDLELATCRSILNTFPDLEPAVEPAPRPQRPNAQ